jgi:hypothetical protein
LRTPHDLSAERRALSFLQRGSLVRRSGDPAGLDQFALVGQFAGKLFQVDHSGTPGATGQIRSPSRTARPPARIRSTMTSGILAVPNRQPPLDGYRAVPLR